ncbi:MAG: efflux RND transporter periplasmic adaptor subunit [Pseudomonadota bacterium]
MPIKTALLLCIALLLAACGGSDAAQDGGPPPVAVDVAEVLSESITEWDEFSGRLEAVDHIEIRPRISGYIAEVHFDEGAVISAGDLLFTIDPREYAASVASAEAEVARAETRLELAQQNLSRSEQLAEARAVSAEELEQRRGETRQADADLRATRAVLAQAELNLEFTRITSPIDGRVGAALADPGNLVVPAESLLTTVVSIDPIHVVFEGDEGIYLNYQAKAISGDRPSSRDNPNPVRVGLAGDSDYPYEGRMDFVDNSVDPSTGTIQGRALIPNPDGFLIPGLFARVRLIGSSGYDALLVNESAVLTDQTRKYVYVVGADNAAVRRDVRLGRNIEGLRVVESGLQAGERVIVNGVRKVFFSGAPVTPTVVPMREQE